ncbi:6-phosphogluconolactonase [Paractinoplanes lichenicola]|uniref:6-phosphogluconolactonase n=1 Tax=Paractinoplanes lichenicola TaxID=2802976 RepID=A0ABS1VR59_9ACTN|nr:6-phosphogluconolactonase [Actinoplanes lichenicola]MBL7256695.1 6-phosphogluconolactonase [Actinoplanes lichenicola]
MSKTLVVVVPDVDTLAATVASRLVAKIVDAQAERGSAGVVLTGGRIAKRVLAALPGLPEAAAVNWSQVDLYWGDERFLPAGDPERNETQAREALLDALPLDPARVHAMPAADGPDGEDAEAAAARYAQELHLGGADLPPFDVLMLGVGEDGHVASLFPEHPVLNETASTTAAVHNSPKPPPTRITLTMPAIQSAYEVWLIAAGPDKSDAIGRALNGDKLLPAAQATGTVKTYWLLDKAAAAAVN